MSTLRSLLLGLVVGVGVAHAAPTPGEIRADDVIGRPGGTLTLKAKLERTGVMGINPDVEEEPLDYYLLAVDGEALEEAKFLGSGETNDDGVATLEWTAEKPGRYQLEVRLRQGSEYVGLPGPLTVAVPAPDRTVVLVQLDETVSTATSLQMFRGTANTEIPAVDGAKPILEALATHYQLVYLTDLDASFTSKFKAWLELRDMPPAPVVFWDLFEDSLSHATYMDKLVAKLVKDVPQVRVGIGGQLSDAKAFVKHGLAGIVLADEVDADERQPEEIWARQWVECLGHVVQIHRCEKLLQTMVHGSAAESAEALRTMTLMGSAGFGYVHRFRTDTDVNLATAATLVAAQLQASDAFFKSLDLSTANAALSSLLAAWRDGDRAVTVRFYRERKAGLAEPLPVFQRAEIVNRSEPAPAKVVFRVRLIPEQGEPFEKELVFVESGDVWLLDVQRGF